MTRRRWHNQRDRLSPAAEQAAHPKSGPRRRPHELSGSLVSEGHSGGSTHVNRSPIFPARFTAGVNLRRLNLLYLQMFALTIALGLRYLGVLLMGSLIIIPAATGKLLARSLNQMLAIAVVVSLLSTLVGEYVATLLHRATGPVIITMAAGVFLIASIVRRR